MTVKIVLNYILITSKAMSMEGSSDKKGILFMPAAMVTIECFEGNKVL